MYQYIYYITADTQGTTADTQGTIKSTVEEAYKSIRNKELRITHTTIEDATEHCIGIIERHLSQRPVTSFYIGKSYLTAKGEIHSTVTKDCINDGLRQ